MLVFPGVKVHNMDYTVILTTEPDGQVSAQVPDLPSVFATGDTLAEAEIHVREAIELYLETLRADGQTAPEPRTVARLCSIAS